MAARKDTTVGPQAIDPQPVIRAAAEAYCVQHGFEWHWFVGDIIEVWRVGAGHLCVARFKDEAAGWELAVKNVAAHVGDQQPPDLAKAETEAAVLVADLSTGMSEVEVAPAAEVPPAAPEAETPSA